MFFSGCREFKVFYVMATEDEGGGMMPVSQGKGEPRVWTVVESKVIADLRFACVREDLLEHPDDGRRFPYYYLQSPADAVATVALTDDGSVILTRQYRHPVGRIIYDLPAGRIDEGESPQEAAVRELEEETGYRAARWQKLAYYNQFPGSMQVGTHLFLARELTPGEQNLDPFEDVEVVKMPFAEAMALVTGGEVLDGSLMLGLLLAAQRGKVAP
jgi:ADP-ribose pyrophosphatase